MKTVVALLLAANLALFGAAQGWLGEAAWRRVHPNRGDAGRVLLELAPEAVTVPKPAAPPAAGEGGTSGAGAAAGEAGAA
ncbi:hypothetical protein, partial [Derxia lacustris]|uniref:hypothetical protein n=1 Tax=Derxia lacustris TaxID=764842 RepID=UPI00111C61B4